MSKKNSRESVDLPGLPPAGAAVAEGDGAVASGEEIIHPAAAEHRYQSRQPEVLRWPGCCPRCGGMERTVLRADTMPHRPLMVANRLFPGRILRRVQCIKCGRRYKENEPVGNSDGTAPAAAPLETQIARVRRLIREQLRAKDENRTADVVRLEREIEEALVCTTVATAGDAAKGRMNGH